MPVARDRLIEVAVGAALGAAAGFIFALLASLLTGVINDKGVSSELPSTVLKMTLVMSILAVPAGAALGTGVSLLVLPLRRSSAPKMYAMAVAATALACIVVVVPVTAITGGGAWTALAIAVSVTAGVVYVWMVRRRWERHADRHGVAGD